MSTIDDYCDHCELPRSQCIHGNPPAPPPEPVRSTRGSRPSPARATGPRTTSAATRAPTPAAAKAATTKPRRRTPPEEFESRILVALEGLGGEGPADEVMDAIAVDLAGSFRSGDEEKGPTGELRWRTACRTARKHLADQGLLVAPRPGVWRRT